MLIETKINLIIFRIFSNLEDRSDAKMIHSLHVYKEKDKERKKITVVQLLHL